MKLRPCLLKILTPDEEQINGTGFFCHPEGYVLTCWHVIEGHLRRKLTEVTVLYDSAFLKALILKERSCRESDIAVLHILEPPSSLDYLRLDTHWRVELNDNLRSFGYPRGIFENDGVPIRGKVGGLDLIPVDSVDVLPIEGLNQSNVNGGYSGAPVFNDRTQRVIGLLYARHKDTQAFFNPICKLFPYWPKLEAYHDIYQQIRQHFAEGARQKLCERLKDMQFISLQLEQGVLPDDNGRASDTKIEPQRQEHRRRWNPLSLDELFPPKRHYLLSSDVGTGKTTFLNWLAAELISKTSEFTPLVMSCTDLEKSNAAHWPDLKNWTKDFYHDQFPQTDLDDFLDWAWKGRLIFLFDGLDQIKSRTYSALANTAYWIAGNNAALITSRPSATLALEDKRSIRFLRLKPFSEDDQRLYFGNAYSEARRIAQFAPELSKVPMLAYMILTLIKKGEAERVETRTEAYERFIQHILSKHEPHVPFYREQRARARQLERGLCTLAYHALAASEPQIQRIEEDLVYESVDESVVDDLPRFGLVNHIFERGQHLFLFTHQSFQEFLAAQYLAEDKHKPERNRVLDERWNPKWKPVIRFLASLKGEQVIEELLAVKDNVIHANLFLAVSCASEIKILSKANLKYIEQGLLPLLEIETFQEDALQAVSTFGHRSKISSELIGAVLESLKGGYWQVRRIALEVLEVFSERLTPAQVDAVVQRLGDDDSEVRKRALEVLKILGKRLTPAQVDAVVDRLGDEDRDVRLMLEICVNESSRRNPNTVR